jgi:hypothetical protein
MESFDLHRLDPDNTYSDAGSASYTPTTAEPTQNTTGFQPIPFQNAPSAPPSTPPRPQFNSSIIQPPVYDGTSDPALWIKEYELIAAANAWDDVIKVKRLIGALNGAPKLYFISALDHNQNLTWFEFRTGLIKRFTNTNENDTSIASILSRKQKDNESFNDYWFTKLQLIETKRPHLPTADKKHLLLEGLKPSLHARIMEKLIIRPTNNLDELRDIAKQTSDLMTTRQTPPSDNYRRKPKNEYSYFAESSQNPTPQRRFAYQQPNRNPNFIPRQQYERRNMNVTNTQANNRTSQRNDDQYNQLSKQINELRGVMMRQHRQTVHQSQTENPIREKFYYNRGGPTKTNQNREQTRTDNMEKKETKFICFRCNEPGHYANKCPLNNQKSNLNRSNDRNLNNKSNSKNANQQKN